MTYYNRFACPNSSCSFYAKFQSGNIAHRSWTGKEKNIERLKCTCCRKEFSQRKATLMENSKISDKTHEQMLKCMRWGVCDEGIADICSVSIKTVRLNQAKASSKLLQKCLRSPELFYGQVVKIRDDTLKLLGVEHRALIGKMREILFFIRAYRLGNKIHTIHVERWYETLRSCLACCRRRTRCSSKSRERHKQKIWIYIDMYNWVINHGSLSIDGNKRTPAMAAGLIDRQLSYQEYIWLPVLDNYKWREKLSEKVFMMNREDMLKASRRIKIKPEKALVMGSEEVAA